MGRGSEHHLEENDQDGFPDWGNTWLRGSNEIALAEWNDKYERREW